MNWTACVLAFLAATPTVLAQEGHANNHPPRRGGGSHVGGGGDFYSSQFITVGRRVVEDLELLAVEQRLGIDPASLSIAIDRTTVESVDDDLSLDGVRVDAINYPTLQRIVFSRPRWDAIRSLSGKKSLVLHEYLGVLGIDDGNYRISAKLIAPGQGVERDPEVIPGSTGPRNFADLINRYAEGKPARAPWAGATYPYLRGGLAVGSLSRDSLVGN